MRVRYAESIALGMFLAVCAPLSAAQAPESGPNLRYQFIQHPLSDVFLVYNDSRSDNNGPLGSAPPPSRALILKITHLVSF